MCLWGCHPRNAGLCACTSNAFNGSYLHARTHARTHTHIHTHARTHTHTHTTHTHTHAAWPFAHSISNLKQTHCTIRMFVRGFGYSAGIPEQALCMHLPNILTVFLDEWGMDGLAIAAVFQLNLTYPSHFPVFFADFGTLAQESYRHFGPVQDLWTSALGEL